MNSKKGVFPCGDNQISNAQELLNLKSSYLGDICINLLNNFSSNSSIYIENWVSNSETEENSYNFQKNYYYDRFFTLLVFCLVFYFYKKISDNIFKDLKETVNNSICTIDEFNRLKSNNTDKPLDNFDTSVDNLDFSEG